MKGIKVLQEKVYLGDAVYAKRDQFGALWLTTEDGIQATNKICLEPEVWDHLQEFMTQELK